MKHNFENPICPDCGGLCQKHGKFTTRQGKQSRYLCLECGRSFVDNTITLPIHQLDEYRSITALGEEKV